MIQSVRPATGIPSSRSDRPSTVSPARFMARMPAPPVSTRVPSISKSTSLDMEDEESVALAIRSFTPDNTSYETAISDVYDLVDTSRRRRSRHRPGAPEDEGQRYRGRLY